MDSEKLNRAKILEKEIRELNGFISTAEKVWTGKLTLKGKIMKFVSNAYGIFESEEYEMNTSMKNKILEVLREHKYELEKEFIDL